MEEAHGLGHLDDGPALLHCGMKTGVWAQVSPLVSSWLRGQIRSWTKGDEQTGTRMVVA